MAMKTYMMTWTNEEGLRVQGPISAANLDTDEKVLKHLREYHPERKNPTVEYMGKTGGHEIDLPTGPARAMTPDRILTPPSVVPRSANR